MHKFTYFISGVLVATISSLFVDGFQTTQREPCIANYRLTYFYYRDQYELDDKDISEDQKKFHEAIFNILQNNGNLYVSKNGAKYVVPSYCEIEDQGWQVVLWKKENPNKFTSFLKQFIHEL